MIDVERVRALLADRYAIRRELGRGASGLVFLADDLKHDRQVAIKVLDESASRRGSTRFQQEIRNAAGLTHPNILAIFDSGEVEGTLYYVMPWVRGESLRSRLDREGKLPVAVAVRIARDVARGMAHAHAQGVVHRDIKPDNLLLDVEGNVYIADFGVARALADPRITSDGLAVGTILYMSPEQASANEDIDGRSDLYALGCVLFKMLTGAPPFVGKTVAAVLKQHIVDDAPSVRSRRADVPEHVDTAIQRVMAKEPADRPMTGETFAQSILVDEPRPPRPWFVRIRDVVSRPAVAGVAAVALLALSLWVVQAIRPRPDPLRVAVLPLRVDGDLVSSPALERAFDDGFTWWRELDVVDRQQVSDALFDTSAQTLSVAGAVDLANGLDAGRFVLGVLSPRGDSLRLDATMYETARGSRVVGSGTITFAAGALPPDSLFRALSDEVLNGSDMVEDGAVGRAGTRSLVARRAFGDGIGALAVMDLERADSSFSHALLADSAFPLADLRLAQVRNWSGSDTDRWRSHAALAYARVQDLTERDRGVAGGLVALANAEFPTACDAYRRLLELDGGGFAAWFGLGECSRYDDQVEEDPDSMTGWRFRSSYQAAVDAYEAAFRSLPASHRAFRSSGFARLRGLLFTREDRLRSGTSLEPPRQSFLGWPAWQGDSLALIPFPLNLTTGAMEMPAQKAFEEALAQQRSIFARIAERWLAAFPDNADALYAVALSLEMVGDPAAMDTIQRARTNATTDRQRRHLAFVHTWLMVKNGIPDQIQMLGQARVLADSLLRTAGPVEREEADELTALAGLLGRPAEAQRYAALGATELHTPVYADAGLARSSARYKVASAGGLSADVIAPLEAVLLQEIGQAYSTEEAPHARAALIEQGAFLSYPEYTSVLLGSAVPFQAPVTRAQLAWISGDGDEARMILDNAHAQRASFRPTSYALEVLFAEANLMALMGDSVTAAARLGPTLEVLRWTQPDQLRGQPTVRPAVLPRALLLRAELALAAGDATQARRWARAVVELGASSDEPAPSWARRADEMMTLTESSVAG